MTDDQELENEAGDEELEPPRENIAEPWSEAEDEYVVLADLVVPAAQDSFYSGSADWAALETKALGILALVAGALAILITVHQDIHRLWWIPAAMLSISGALLIGAVWPRDYHFGPDLLDFHYELRDQSPLDASRQLLTELVDATRENDVRLSAKTTLFWWGLGVLLAALLACLPVVLVRPQ